MPTLNERLNEVAKHSQHRENARLGARRARPRLTAETATDTLDWIGQELMTGNITQSEAQILMKAAELAISTKHAEAQAKATQHTLVEEGVIAPPPVAS